MCDEKCMHEKCTNVMTPHHSATASFLLLLAKRLEGAKLDMLGFCILLSRSLRGRQCLSTPLKVAGAGAANTNMTRNVQSTMRSFSAALPDLTLPTYVYEGEMPCISNIHILY